MIMLRVCAKIQSEKFREFQQAMESLTEDRALGSHEYVYERIDDNSEICLVGTWESQEELSSYLQSKRFQFFSGAISVLGEVSTAKIMHVEQQETLVL